MGNFSLDALRLVSRAPLLLLILIKDHIEKYLGFLRSQKNFLRHVPAREITETDEVKGTPLNPNYALAIQFAVGT